MERGIIMDWLGFGVKVMGGGVSFGLSRQFGFSVHRTSPAGRAPAGPNILPPLGALLHYVVRNTIDEQ